MSYLVAADLPAWHARGDEGACYNAVKTTSGAPPEDNGWVYAIVPAACVADPTRYLLDSRDSPGMMGDGHSALDLVRWPETKEFAGARKPSTVVSTPR